MKYKEFNIVSHSNVYDDCLRLIKKKGFVLDVEWNDDSTSQISYIATKKIPLFGSKFKLVADSPVELLGLVTLADRAEFHPDDPWWGYVDGPDNLDKKLLKKLF